MLIEVEGSNGVTFDRVGIGVGVDDRAAIRDATKAMSVEERRRPYAAIPASRFNVRKRRVTTVEQESWD